jgi:hypothetical protein
VAPPPPYCWPSATNCPGNSTYGSWGEVYVYDNTNPAAPAFLGTFSTPDSRSTRTDGDYTDHNTEVAGNGEFFSSWYSDGIVHWTMDDHGASRQLGQFVPPATDTSAPEVWGVALADGLVLASDIHTGLWIAQPTRS